VHFFASSKVFTTMLSNFGQAVVIAISYLSSIAPKSPNLPQIPESSPLFYAFLR